MEFIGEAYWGVGSNYGTDSSQVHRRFNAQSNMGDFVKDGAKRAVTAKPGQKITTKPNAEDCLARFRGKVSIDLLPSDRTLSRVCQHSMIRYS